MRNFLVFSAWLSFWEPSCLCTDVYVWFAPDLFLKLLLTGHASLALGITAAPC